MASLVGRDPSTEELYSILNGLPAVKTEFNNVMIRLKRRQLAGSQVCAKETLELLRTLLARYTFSSTEQMMRVVKAFGRELSTAAPTELTIGNVVRRVLFCIREEHQHQLNAVREQEEKEKRPRGSSKDFSSRRSTRSNSLTDTLASKRDRSGSVSSVNSNDMNTAAGGAAGHSLETISETGATPTSTTRVTIRDSVDVAPSATYNSGQHNASLLKVSHHFDSMLSHLDARDEDAADSFQQQFPALKSAVIAAVNELSTEVDAYASISQRAPDYIHADETILTYGYSKIIELFCKHAGNKRRFQLIIAEGAVQGSRSGPNAPAALNGHDLAHILSKHSANIAVTVIPDSNIYAIMARVNKVLLAPQAIMADGGAIAPAGHCMVATAAKEFAVPVVCCSGPFSLTPLFAHNQSIALQQLQCPASTLPLPMMSMVDNRLRHAIHEDNVTVLYPAFDHITPDLISIYVTNDGSQLPTYVFRQLSEYYHPQDYIL